MTRRVVAFVCSFPLLLLCATGAAQDRGASSSQRPVRSLRVALYPFIPGYLSSAQRIKDKFEAAHPDVVLELVDLSSNYYARGSDNYVGAANADVFELDSVLLRDFVAEHKIVPMPIAALLPSDQLLKSADLGTTLDGKRYGAAHWVCHDFLFYSKGDKALAGVKTLSDLKAAIGPAKLLMDLRGKSTLGEYYLVAALDRYHDWNRVYSDKIKLPPDPPVEGDVRSLAKLCDVASCRSLVLHDYTGTHGAEFARKQGRALIGYSEALNSVLTEVQNCSDPSACVTPNDIAVADFPMGDTGSTPMIWVDSFALSSTCAGACSSDAVAFVRMMNEDDTYRALLFPENLPSMIAPQPAAPVPSYLMPAKASLYTDAAVLERAPLYPTLKQLIEGAVVPTGLGLNDSLRSIGKQIDKDLDKP